MKTRDLRSELRDADWPRLLPRLSLYAGKRLRMVGWGHGRNDEPSAASVQDVVNAAIDRCLDGTRTWNNDDPPELEPFLCGVIKSIVWSERKSFLRSPAASISQGAGADVELLAEERVADTEARDALRAEIEMCVEDDEDLSMLWLAIQDGAVKPREIAEVLGWDVKTVATARIKLQRRLIRMLPSRFASHKKTRVVS